ncbi:MAG: HAD family hydrolase [Firmicutes bacterium]|nr:HAD family hydrolase [Bacillota bacterium]
MQKNRKLIALDVDGTLLDSTHQILPSTKRALRQLASQGHVILLATARPPRSTANIAKQLGMPDALFIALNGATIVCSGEIITEHSIQRHAVQLLVKETRHRQLHANLMADWNWFIEDDSPWCQKEAEIVGISPTKVADLTDLNLPSAQKILIIGDVKDISAFYDWALAETLPISVSLSKPNYCEIVQQGVSKAHALLEAGKMLGIPPADIIAFGDGDNDKELVEVAGIGVAMGNSMPTVIEAADFVTKTNDNDGIYHALMHYGLISL